jgi:hypothetical protein
MQFTGQTPTQHPQKSHLFSLIRIIQTVPKIPNRVNDPQQNREKYFYR